MKCKMTGGMGTSMGSVWLFDASGNPKETLPFSTIKEMRAIHFTVLRRPAPI